MNEQPQWQYDEMAQSGVDYCDSKHVEAYDKRHEQFRDYEKETRAIIEKLGTGADDTVIDLGCGTGAFTLNAANHCKKIIAVDVSQVMLDHTSQKARQAKLDNIEFHHGGFLTYEHTGKPVDAIVTALALHHLPDFWKLIALRNLASMLKPAGKLYLSDVVFSFDMEGYKTALDKWGKMFGEKVDSEFSAEALMHVREEFSTMDWIMEGLLERAGFKIEQCEYKDNFVATYLCVKPL